MSSPGFVTEMKAILWNGPIYLRRVIGIISLTTGEGTITGSQYGSPVTPPPPKAIRPPMAHAHIGRPRFKTHSIKNNLSRPCQALGQEAIVWKYVIAGSGGNVDWNFTPIENDYQGSNKPIGKWCGNILPYSY